MRITFVVPGFARHPVGGIRVVYCLANSLTRRGHEIVVVHEAFSRRPPLGTSGPARRQLEELVSGVRAVAHGPPAVVRWEHVDERVDLRYELRASRKRVPDGDAIVATAWQTAEFVANLPTEKGRGLYFIQGLETWSGTPRRVDATWKLPLRKLFIADWLFDRACQMRLPDVHRIPAAVDTDVFRVLAPIAERPARVAMLYSSAPGKGCADGVAALELAKHALPRLEAVLFGVPARPKSLPRWIEYVRDPSQEQLVNRIYNGSALYLCPSRSEGWHLPPAEALACGCALVSTDIAGVAEYAEHGRTARLSAVGDVRGLADHLVALLRDDATRSALADEGNRRVRRSSWDRAAAAFERLVEEPHAAVQDEYATV